MLGILKKIKSKRIEVDKFEKQKLNIKRPTSGLKVRAVYETMGIVVRQHRRLPEIWIIILFASLITQKQSRWSHMSSRHKLSLNTI